MAHSVDLKKEIEAWRKKIGLDSLQPFSTGELEWALNASGELSEQPIDKIGACMIILSNHLYTLAEQMGVTFARVRYLESTHSDREQLTLVRAQLNIVKPVHDALKEKIAVIKKIYDHKSREAQNVASNRR